ncbi:P-type ATPase [Streptomyces finlayi]|uniref:P-type ATPase n=1 Tax=Streptomyces finlayi TaxID=67296 RepID=UPI0021564008|nr:hypothetical protein [Streptomyces finlayi]
MAGAISEIKDALVIAAVLLIDANIGFLRERRAERSLEASRQMLVPTARVRHDGLLRVIPAGAPVPGDVVLLEAGDRVPADGRLAVHVPVSPIREAQEVTGGAVARWHLARSPAHPR